MAKTKIVFRSVKVKGNVKTPAESPKTGFFRHTYFDSFVPPNTKRSTIKSFPKLSLVSLTLRARTVF